ncbi:hypothetical protein POSPLADRAFT_1151619 [Postia placenta MAD-698-R-SB12]|uniref:Polyketide synthase-like phosphopantetheine-binding domain-containing protein n=1 Tax=Postia placenta MAD-698-R-SB12 TaxID=670580 RepID=A0A1X6MQZ4_9APHY|nr:hypothetical protein POSPLADRAFT_1151619 [Postia placenta MAD-698-R-SB12]OSX58824.1 hypothetical protein POSPLADRAFT_1151619 [Postia placenta MAD-698-R-SB12]
MPPLDGSLALPELYEWHAEHSPDHPLFVFAKEDGSVHKLCWPEVLRAVYTGVKIIRDRAHWQPGMTKAPVVAILSNSDSVPYATTTMAIMRANCTAFLISSRNSPAAVAHLLNKVGAKHLLVGDEPSMHGLCKESLDILKTQYSEATVPETSTMLGFEELYLPVSQSPSREDVPYEYKGAKEPAVILHSSGSTAFPKPITLTTRCLLERVSSISWSERDLAGHIISVHAMPMFHAMGMIFAAYTASDGIEKMNKFAPQHSRLFKEMILVTRSTKPFSYTAKHSIRRSAIIQDYEDEIADLYDTVNASAQSSIQPPTDWALPATTEYVRTVVGKVMTHAVADSVDVFQHGCDSLQATYIRNIILRALRETTKIDTRRIGDSFVYDHPTISSLAAFASSVAQGTHDSATAGTTASARIMSMRAMLAKYAADFPARPQTLLPSQPERDAVFVTGTTGSLGCHLLALLVADPKVGRVYAFNRPAKTQTHLRERQKSALVDRGLDAGIVDSEKVMLLEGSLTAEHWGLEKSAYEEIFSNIELSHRLTDLHSAWRVDFVTKLESFEVNVADSPGDVVFTEGPIEPNLAAGTGYAESKWVSEQILYTAASKTSLNALVVRVGQVCGGLDGAWNVHEWFPTLVQSALRLGCFPDDDKGVNWVPAEIAAGAIVDFSHHASNTTRTVHLVHPRPVPWHILASAVASELAVPLVPYSEWLAKLEQAYQVDKRDGLGNTEQDNNRDLRTLQLLPFFRGVAGKLDIARMAMGMPALSIEQAVARSPTLADHTIRQLGEEDVKRWLAYWRKVGLL